jgi:hypothetical protein
MSAFGNAGGGDFEEEAFDSYEAEDQQPDAMAGSGSSASAAQSATAADSLAAPSGSALSTSPRSPPSVGSHLLSGSASAFDDEDDFASSPLHAQAVAQYAQAANVSLSKPNPLQASFHSAPPPLTINNGRDSVLSRVPVSNPLLQTPGTAGQDSQPLQSGGVASSSASSLRPAVVGNPTLPRIHTSPPSYDDSKTSLEALWSQQAATDPSLFTHAVYSRTTHFGKGEVHVIDPEKKGDGISSYIVYKVKSSIEHSPGKVTEATVSRRYSDFLWLHEHLFLTPQLSGFLVPPIPDKAVVGRFAEDFVEERRRSLEMFIKRVVAHPIVSSTKHSAASTARCMHHRGSPCCGLWLCFIQLRETEQARVFLQGDEKVGQLSALPAMPQPACDCG